MPHFTRRVDLPPARLGDAVYDRIAAAIVDGSLAPGERIRDLDIAESLGVSRMPVREALQRLEREGLIEMSASRYTRVTEITPAMVAASIEYARHQTGIAARIAIARMTPAEQDASIALVDSLWEAVDSGDAERVHERYFTCFLFLVEHTGNPVFRSATNEARFTLERNIRGGVSPDAHPRAIAPLFDDLRDAIRARDAHRAEQTILEIFDATVGQPPPERQAELA
ncbi:GntR family transcriptional regulator [Microbacterium betulae]|uniref:GntR family transcriptional regulator n=1 Tax=Microbacterium betulae TaxID=2981139 RepID=A0AA97FGQ7_9MICO|nr:GntR family transcriptional regulator [Microbacterium sp. AB]WOF22189.1 GntR family transcriptional regulator [Microbacterium sp. AB]